MWKILQLDTPTDLVIATGKSATVREFVNIVAKILGMELFWDGEGTNEVARDSSGRVIVRVDPGYFRPLEVHDLRGDATRAREVLNWSPEISLEALAAEMVESDLRNSKN
jgi:GDPmannose 4,6-dehydratase